MNIKITGYTEGMDRPSETGGKLIVFSNYFTKLGLDVPDGSSVEIGNDVVIYMLDCIVALENLVKKGCDIDCRAVIDQDRDLYSDVMIERLVKAHKQHPNQKISLRLPQVGSYSRLYGVIDSAHRTLRAAGIDATFY